MDLYTSESFMMDLLDGPPKIDLILNRLDVSKVIDTYHATQGPTLCFVLY